MDFSITDNQNMIIEMIQKFGEIHIIPNSTEWDNDQHFPVDVLSFSRIDQITNENAPNHCSL